MLGSVRRFEMKAVGVVMLGFACAQLRGGGCVGQAQADEAGSKKPAVVRFAQNPIIRPEMLPGSDGANINGPSLIRVPAWLEKPFGKYYLYFAHHGGKYIRMAYADRLEGPWTIHKPGVLSLQEAIAVNPGCSGHIASPDVLVDDDTRQIRMYFHCPVKGKGQSSMVAFSKDGLHFEPRKGILGDFYFRVFRWDGAYWSIDRRGMISRSPDGVTPFEKASETLAQASDDKAAGASFRHCAVQLDGDVLSVFICRMGDAPESILLSKIKLTPDPKDWRASAPVKILEPETTYEGTDLPVTKSQNGATKRARALRDPCIYREGGKTYLLYAVAGESGIAIAELTN